MKAEPKPLRLACGAHLSFEWTRIMGVLNVTPDSFSDGGQYLDPAIAISRGLEMEAAGADIIDVGGESTRPGSKAVPPAEQIRRVVPVIRGIRAASSVPISIDTTSSSVAFAALESGASMVNDISAFRFDAEMVPLLASSGAPAVAMHTLDRPSVMQQEPTYLDVVDEVRRHLAERVQLCVEAGIEKSQILIDPGIGFGKNLHHNLALLRHLDAFVKLGHAVLVGTSRKSFLGALTGKDIAHRREATAASVAVSISRGAHVVRVHDVAALKDTVTVADGIRYGMGKPRHIC